MCLSEKIRYCERKGIVAMKKLHHLLLRKGCALLLALSVLVGLASPAAAESTHFIGGSGTPEDPYIISNKTHLINAADYPSACFELIADLTFSAGDTLPGFSSFSGSFDGKGHTVSLPDTVASAPLFGTLSGTVENLTLDGSFTDASFASSVKASGVLRHCRNIGAVTGTSDAGGLAEFCSGIIEDCSNAGPVTSQSCAGGIVSTATNGIIRRCYNTGDIRSSGYDYDDYAGGIAAYKGTIQNCYNTGVVAGGSVGGIAGYAYKLSHCYSCGSVEGRTYYGGIAATSTSALYGNASDCHYLDIVTAEKRILFSDYCYVHDYEEMCSSDSYSQFDFDEVWTMGSDIYPMPVLRDNPHIEYEPNTTEFAGGTGKCYDPYLIGTVEQLKRIDRYPSARFRITNDITVYDWTPLSRFYGGLDGQGYRLKSLYMNLTDASYGGLFKECSGILENIVMENADIYVRGIANNGNNPYAGAFCGRLYDPGLIRNCHTVGASGSITATAYYSDYLGGNAYITYGYAYAGGIAGSSTGTVTGCTNTASVSSNGDAGGIVATGGKVVGCFNHGSVSVYANKSSPHYHYTGGIAGSGAVSGCGNTGDVSCTNTTDNDTIYVGGVLGHGGSISGCYNMGNVTGRVALGVSYLGGIVGCSTDNYGNEPSARLSVSDCFSSGDVKVTSSKSNTGSTMPAFYIGGITGNGNTKHCYFLGWYTYFGTTASNRHYGDFTGNGTDQGSIHASFYTYGSNGIDSTYCASSGYPGFDFVNTWTFDPLMDYQYAVPAAALTPPKSLALAPEVETVLTTVVGVWPELGQTVILTGKDGSTHSVALARWMLPDVKIDRIGTQVVEIRYAGVDSGQYIIFEIQAPSPVSIEVSTPPAKLTYIKNQESFDPAGGIITVHYNNNTTSTVALKEAEITGFDNTVSGPRTLTVTYLEQSTTLEIEIIEAVGITFGQLPDKRTYVQGQPISLDGGQLLLQYSDGSTAPLDSGLVTVSVDPTLLGTVTVTVSYEAFQCTFRITVTERIPESASFVEPSNVSCYEGEALDLSTGYLEVVFRSEDGYSEQIPITPEMVRGFSPNEEGYQTVQVVYGSFSWDLIVRVKCRIARWSAEETGDGLRLDITLAKDFGSGSLRYLAAAYRDGQLVEAAVCTCSSLSLQALFSEAEADMEFRLFVLDGAYSPLFRAHTLQ